MAHDNDDGNMASQNLPGHGFDPAEADRYITDPEFREQIDALCESYQERCVEAVSSADSREGSGGEGTAVGGYGTSNGGDELDRRPSYRRIQRQRNVGVDGIWLHH